jgi:hypothetical protein
VVDDPENASGFEDGAGIDVEGLVGGIGGGHQYFEGLSVVLDEEEVAFALGSLGQDHAGHDDFIAVATDAERVGERAMHLESGPGRGRPDDPDVGIDDGEESIAEAGESDNIDSGSGYRVRADGGEDFDRSGRVFQDQRGGVIPEDGAADVDSGSEAARGIGKADTGDGQRLRFRDRLPLRVNSLNIFQALNEELVANDAIVGVELESDDAPDSHFDSDQAQHSRIYAIGNDDRRGSGTIDQKATGVVPDKGAGAEDTFDLDILTDGRVQGGDGDLSGRSERAMSNDADGGTQDVGSACAGRGDAADRYPIPLPEVGRMWRKLDKQRGG